jgi:hypothetical protein
MSLRPPGAPSRELDEQAGSLGASGCSDRISNGTDEAGDSPGGDRSCHRGWCALWLCVGRCRLWAECALPPGAHSSQTCLGGRNSSSPQGVSCRVYPADVEMIWPVAGRGRPRKRHVPDILSMAADDMLANATWQNISWRTGTKGKLKARFAAVRVRMADGHHSESGARASNICQGRRPDYRRTQVIGQYISPTCRQRRTCAPWRPPSRRDGFASGSPQLKGELGLDHFEGRSWQGLHRHALMTMIAYVFLQHRRLATARREKKNQRTTAPADFAPYATPSSNSSLRLPPQRCPHCRKRICNEQRRE